MWGIRNWRGVVIAVRATHLEASKAAERLCLEPWEFSIEDVGTVEDLERQRRADKAKEKKAPRELYGNNFMFPPDLDLKRKQ